MAVTQATNLADFSSGINTDGNVINVGTALTLSHSDGIQFHTQHLHATGFDVNNINASGIITARSNIDVGTGTSIFSPASNVLTLGTNNEERLRITSDGDVSISSDGTVHGVSKLTILPANRTTAFSASDGDSWHDVVLKQTGSATNNAVGIAFAVSGDAYHKNAGIGIAAVKNGTNSDYGADLVFITRPQSAVAEERLRITSAGALNIGKGDESTNAANLVEIYVGATDGTYGTIRGKYNRSNEYTRSEVRFGVESNASGLGFLAFATGNNSATERLRIDSSGNAKFISNARQVIIQNGGTAGQPEIAFRNAADTGDAYGNIDGATLDLKTGGTSRLRIDSAGLVGIGSEIPSRTLDVSGTGTFSGSLRANPLSLTSGDSWIKSGYGAISNSSVLSLNNLLIGQNMRGYMSGLDGGSNNNNFYHVVTHGGMGYNGIEFCYSGIMKFYTNSGATTANNTFTPSERLRINSNGDVTTTGAAYNRANAGFTARAGDSVNVTRASGTPLEVNRTGNDGTIVNFFQDGSVVGSIGVDGDDLWLGANGSSYTESLRITSGGEVYVKGNDKNHLKNEYRGNVSVTGSNNSTFAFEIQGSSYGSGGLLYVYGTSGNVVLNCSAEILVNHSADVIIKSMNSAYTATRIRVKTDNNARAAIYLGRSGGYSSGTTTIYWKFIPYGGTYAYTTESTNSGTDHTHNGSTGTLKITGAGGANGNINIQGSISKGSGTFTIPHPLESKKETHNLAHSFIEGPQCDLIYRGKVNLIDGASAVNIDTNSGMTEGTFVALCRDVQCFTTNETGWTAIKGSVTGNILNIIAQENTCTDTISWMVVGERQDDNIKQSTITDNDGNLIVEPLIEPEYDESNYPEYPAP